MEGFKMLEYMPKTLQHWHIIFFKLCSHSWTQSPKAYEQIPVFAHHLHEISGFGIVFFFFRGETGWPSCMSQFWNCTNFTNSSRRSGILMYCLGVQAPPPRLALPFPLPSSFHDLSTTPRLKTGNAGDRWWCTALGPRRQNQRFGEAK